MSIRTPGLIKAYDAETAVAAYTICKFGTTEDLVVEAAATTDNLMGVSSEIDSEVGERCDVIRSGIAPVLYGGTVAAGDLLTSDANGHAITTTTASDRIIGIAEVAGVDGDRGSVLICPGIV